MASVVVGRMLGRTSPLLVGRNARNCESPQLRRAKCSKCYKDMQLQLGEMLGCSCSCSWAKCSGAPAAAVGQNAPAAVTKLSSVGDLGSAPVECSPNLFWTGVPEVYRLGQGRSACSWSHAVHAELPA